MFCVGGGSEPAKYSHIVMLTHKSFEGEFSLLFSKVVTNIFKVDISLFYFIVNARVKLCGWKLLEAGCLHNMRCSQIAEYVKLFCFFLFFFTDRKKTLFLEQLVAIFGSSSYIMITLVFPDWLTNMSSVLKCFQLYNVLHEPTRSSGSLFCP